MILSDLVLREQNARARGAAPPVTPRSKWSVRDRWMHRAARLRVNQGDNEGVDSVSMTEWASADLPVRLPTRRRRREIFMRQLCVNLKKVLLLSCIMAFSLLYYKERCGHGQSRRGNSFPR